MKADKREKTIMIVERMCCCLSSEMCERDQPRTEHPFKQFQNTCDMQMSRSACCLIRTEVRERLEVRAGGLEPRVPVGYWAKLIRTAEGWSRCV